jgi:hypothetical protein
LGYTKFNAEINIILETMELVRLNCVRYQVNEAWTVPYWIDETQFEGQASLTGTVCGLDRPFTLTLDGIIGNGRTVGEVLFLPVSKTGGTWSFEGTASVSGGSTSVTGSSTYQLVGVADEAPVILMDAASNWTMTIPLFGTLVFEGALINEGVNLVQLDFNGCDQ